MFCPQCRTGYREGFYTCKDCDVSLVWELPPEPAQESLAFEEIPIALSASDTAMISSLLDSEGITYYFQGKYPDSFAPTRLMVREDQVDAVREILEGLKLSEPLTSGGSKSHDGE